MLTVHHIGYLVKNIEKSIIAFKNLGYSEIKYSDEFITEDEIRQCNICFLEKDGYCVELVAPLGKDSPIYGLLNKYKNAPYHICYRTDAFEKDVEHLKEKGFMIIKESEIAPAINNERVIFMMNPAAGMIELVF